MGDVTDDVSFANADVWHASRYMADIAAKSIEVCVVMRYVLRQEPALPQDQPDQY